MSNLCNSIGSGVCKMHSSTKCYHRGTLKASRGPHRLEGTNKRCFVSAAIIITSLIRPSATANSTINNGASKQSVRSFVGKRLNRKGNSQDTDGAGLTLGDLDQMLQKDESNTVLGPNIIFGSDGIGAQHQHNQQYHESTEEELSPNPKSNHLRKGLGRINLDLSGRFMCHIISPQNEDESAECNRKSIPLFTIQTKEQRPTLSSSRSSESQRAKGAHNLQRFIPHVFLGANYDLDEVWYGATRWIAKCSWGPLVKVGDPSNEMRQERGNSLQLLTNQVLNTANNVQRKIFLSSKSSLRIDVDAEQSVFDRSDTTARVRLIQSPLSDINTMVQPPQQISMEYDSAKYFDTHSAQKRQIQYAPTISVDVKTPFLHPRLVVHSKKTWIVKEGGDNEGNYYGGDYYGSESCADRRLEHIKTRFREGVPRSNTIDSAGKISNRAHSFGTKLSRWLENDGWMPRRVTTDLMGNLVSVSEVGFGNTLERDTLNTKVPKRPRLHGIIPPIQNTGIRLRISKRIDWTTLGIFPWSKNDVNDDADRGNNGLLDALQSTHVRLELCGLYGSEERYASVGFAMEPLDWSRTFQALCTEIFANSSSGITTDDITSELLEWLRESGSYINEKLVVRQLVPDDPSSTRGIFATEDMDSGEVVCNIPWKLILKPSEEFQLKKRTDQSDCGTIKAVVQELSGNELTPYGRYLLALPKGYTAGFWSQPAVDVLLEMLDTKRAKHLTVHDELPPHGVDDVLDDLEQECDADVNDSLYRHAAMIVKSRADYEYLVPFYDMMNHHNGRYNVMHVYNPYKPDPIDQTGYEIATTKKIKKGGQLYLSYNHCNICQESYDWFGTPELFLHYGFVEPIPQRWLFDFARVKFDLDWKNGDESTSDVVVNFLVPPSRKGIGLLQEELVRLKSFSATHRSMAYKGLGILTSEWELLWHYYDALYKALSYAVEQSRQAGMSDEVWTVDDNWWVSSDGTLLASDIDEHLVLPIVNA